MMPATRKNVAIKDMKESGSGELEVLRAFALEQHSTEGRLSGLYTCIAHSSRPQICLLQFSLHTQALPSSLLLAPYSSSHDRPGARNCHPRTRSHKGHAQQEHTRPPYAPTVMRTARARHRVFCLTKKTYHFVPELAGCFRLLSCAMKTMNTHRCRPFAHARTGLHHWSYRMPAHKTAGSEIAVTGRLSARRPPCPRLKLGKGRWPALCCVLVCTHKTFTKGRSIFSRSYNRVHRRRAIPLTTTTTRRLQPSLSLLKETVTEKY